MYFINQIFYNFIIFLTQIVIESNNIHVGNMGLWRLDDLPYFEYDNKNNKLSCD